jgi:hypothetical protein
MFLKRLHINLPKKPQGPTQLPTTHTLRTNPKQIFNRTLKTGKLWTIAPFTSMISIFKMIPRSSQNICPTPKSYLNYPISMAENSSTFEARKIGGSSHLASGTPQTPSPLMDDPPSPTIPNLQFAHGTLPILIQHHICRISQGQRRSS